MGLPPRLPRPKPPPTKRAKPVVRTRARRSPGPTGGLSLADLDELAALRAQVARVSAGEPPPRWNADAEDVHRSVIKLVLTLVEFIRQLLERQAIRRMEDETLTDFETEALGQALMTLEETVHDMTARFGLTPEDLNLDLGPLGRML